MHVDYTVELTQKLGLPYRLLQYYDESNEVDDPYGCQPVLFIPGNQGSYKQSRTIGSWLAMHSYKLRNDRCYTVYSVDLLEQHSVLSNRVLQRQAEFITLDALPWIAEKHGKSRPLVVVAHSMGSLVARLALEQSSSKIPTTLISLAAPIDRSVLEIDGRVKLSYKTDIPNVKQIFMHGGHADIQIPSDRSPSSPAVLNTETIPMVWASPDHQAIVWVHHIVEYLGRYIHSLISEDL